MRKNCCRRCRFISFLIFALWVRFTFFYFPCKIWPKWLHCQVIFRFLSGLLYLKLQWSNGRSSFIREWGYKEFESVLFLVNFQILKSQQVTFLRFSEFKMVANFIMKSLAVAAVASYANFLMLLISTLCFCGFSFQLAFLLKFINACLFLMYSSGIFWNLEFTKIFEFYNKFTFIINLAVYTFTYWLNIVNIKKYLKYKNYWKTSVRLNLMTHFCCLVFWPKFPPKELKPPMF